MARDEEQSTTLHVPHHDDGIGGSFQGAMTVSKRALTVSPCRRGSHPHWAGVCQLLAPDSRWWLSMFERPHREMLKLVLLLEQLLYLPLLLL